MLRGAVQGVGFRPTVYRLAGSLCLAGWVRNSGTGLEIEIEGGSEQLDRFLQKLKADRPRAAVVTMEEVSRIAPTGSAWFEILPSDESVSKTAAVLPDLATCPECLRELLDPGDRRFGYAFTNCTLCGPRYTILNDIPYDRPNTYDARVSFYVQIAGGNMNRRTIGDFTPNRMPALRVVRNYGRCRSSRKALASLPMLPKHWREERSSHSKESADFNFWWTLVIPAAVIRLRQAQAPRRETFRAPHALPRICSSVLHGERSGRSAADLASGTDCSAPAQEGLRFGA